MCALTRILLLYRGQKLGNDNTGNDTQLMLQRNTRLGSTTRFNREDQRIHSQNS